MFHCTKLLAGLVTMKRINIEKGCRITNIDEFSEDKFIGSYRNHYIQIEREKEDQFYIIVNAPCGSSDYDGYWDGPTDATMAQAIKEALEGACII